jgi:dTDP-4-amino-4,6-dideoxygalactose transaminase
VSHSLKVPFLDLALQYHSIQEELETAALRTLRSGRYIMGDEVVEFERGFAEYTGSRYAVGVASGTDAIHLSLRALGIGPGHDVLTVANVSAPTVCAILATGARPVLIDIDPRTFNMDPNRLADYLNKSRERNPVKAIVPVHLYGRPADMKSIMEIAKKFDIKVVEDASQSHGATIGDAMAGTIGEIGCFSLYPTKNLGACGDAGVIVTNHELMAEKLQMLRNYGEKSRYENSLVGFNSRLDEIQASLLSVKLKHLNRWTERRRQIACQYHQSLGKLGIDTPGDSIENLAGHVYHLYVIQVANRDQFRSELMQLGVGTAVHYPKPIHHQFAFHAVCVTDGTLEVTEQACRNVVSLPLYPEMSDEAVEMVCNSISHLVRSGRCTLQNMVS